MTINVPASDSSNLVDSRAEIVSWINQDLKNSLDFDSLLKDCDNLVAIEVPVREMRDVANYPANDILVKMFVLAKKLWYTNIKMSDKKVDKDGNIISMSLQWESSKYGGCFVRLAFVRNCSFWKTSWSNETCILDEYYDDADLEMIIDSDVCPY